MKEFNLNLGGEGNGGVILKDSHTICFDSGEGRIQVYVWKI